MSGEKKMGEVVMKADKREKRWDSWGGEGGAGGLLVKAMRGGVVCLILVQLFCVMVL